MEDKLPVRCVETKQAMYIELTIEKKKERELSDTTESILISVLA